MVEREPDEPGTAADDAPAESPVEAGVASGDGGGSAAAADAGSADDSEPATDPETLRAAVEARYDFDDFRPADMARMSLAEWEAAFDPDTWITGEALLDRVEDELRWRVAAGQLFAVVERHAVGDGTRLLVYDDAEYATVDPDGTVAGDDGVCRQIEPVVALCSMDSFEVATPPANASLPDPDDIGPGSSELGHRLLLAVAMVQALAGLVLLVSPLVVSLGPGAGALTAVIGLGFVVVGLVLGVLVANARLSDRFRSAAYRDRLLAAGVGRDERPAFLPPMGEAPTDNASGVEASGRSAEDGGS